MILLYILIFLILCIYIRHALIIPITLEIIKCNSSKIQSVINDKQPILITDSITDIHDFIKHSFKMSFTKKHSSPYSILLRNISTHCILCNTLDNNTVYIIHPKARHSYRWKCIVDNNEISDNIVNVKTIHNGVSIPLKLNQIIILPFGCLYIVDKEIPCYAIYSLIHYFHGSLFKAFQIYNRNGTCPQQGEIMNL